MKKTKIDALINKPSPHGIYAYLDNIRHPLPIMRGWSASPDFILRLINIITEINPKTILDIGSGVTSLIAGYCIEKLGSGKVVSLDHDKKYYDITKDNIKKHGLKNIIELYYAPLSEYEINNKKWLWYKNDFTKKHSDFDLVIIDGPPGPTQPKSRYPAIPLLKNKLSKKCIIMLDDGKRNDEKEIVNMWINENKELKHIYFEEDEKGTYIIFKLINF